MSSREKILATVLHNQPQLTPLPDISIFKVHNQDIVQKYIDTFIGIGGKIFSVESIDAVKILIPENFDITKRIVTTLPELTDVAELYSPTADPHSFQDVELAIINAHFSVAENGAVWLTEPVMGHRILPYICQHLAVIVSATSIVSTMHDAYARIGEDEYGFGAFIGGPSKTADIEQALVMGAHGPITMTVFIIK
jgi:L-lactate dehydrogenase complex protein LldG